MYTDEQIDELFKNKIPNLQLLEGKENESKNKKIKNNQKRTYNFRKSIV